MKQHKHILSLALALILCLGVAAPALAANSDFAIENGVLTKYTGPGGAVTIPDSVTSIGESAFENCTGLTSVTIHSGVTTIDYGAFYGCSGLTSIIIPDSVTEIGFLAFYGCTSLTDISVSKGNANYSSQDGVLFNKNKTTLIGFPEGKTGTYRIPDGVTVIGEGAFYKCTGLTSVTLPESMIRIEMMAFQECTNLKDINFPDSLKLIGHNAFLECNSLQTLRLPKDAQTFGCASFRSCANLTSFTVDPKSQYYTAIDGVLYSKDGTRIVAYPAGKTEASYVIPKNVDQIDSLAFESSKLTSISIPDSVTTINWGAFASCNGLTNMTLPNRLTHIDVSTFIGCAGLTSVTIPASVTNIDDAAFRGCYNLSDIYYTGNETQWKAIKVGDYNDYLAKATIHYNSDPDTLDSISSAQADETPEEVAVRAKIEALREEYPEGMRWTNEDGGYFSKALGYTGYGCAGFSAICSDAAFGDAPVTKSHSNFDEIRVGDILHINNDTHSMVVLYKLADSVIVTEGNYNNSIHWDRRVFRTALENDGLVVTTRWGTATQDNAATLVVPSATGIAYPSTQTVDVDGSKITFECYALKDENGYDTNYIKLRDLADILNGSEAQFEVGWDGDITITTGKAYTRNGSEKSTPFSGQRAYEQSAAATLVDGKVVDLDAIVLTDDAGGGYTYYQLRDLGKTLGFNVGWSTTRGMFLETDKPYNPDN